MATKKPTPAKKAKAQTEEKPKRAAIDWEAIEIHYRAGIRSLKDIGTEYGVSDAGIIKRAKRDGWERDLKAKIQAKAAAKVSAALVSAEVSPQTKLTEAVRIEVESEVQARIELGHRRDIARGRTLAMKLLDELELQTNNVPELEQLGELMAKPDEKGIDKLNELYHKIIALPSRTKVMKDLGDTLKTLIALEREAYGIGSKVGDGGTGDINISF